MKIFQILTLFALLTGPLHAAIEVETDYAKARERAKKENKGLLLEFVGLDWCTPCEALRSRVLSLEAFELWMAEDFIWVELDFPLDKAILAMRDPALKEQNAKLQARYSVPSFPSLYLCDSSGRPYGRKVGYDKTGTPEEYLLALATLQENGAKRDAAFKRARKLKGAERFAALEEALSVVPADCLREFYPEQLRMLEKNLPECAVVKAEHKYSEHRALMGELTTEHRARENEKVIERVNEVIEAGSFEGAYLQEVLLFKAQAHFALGEHDAAREAATKVAEIDLKNRYGTRAKRLVQKIAAKEYKERTGMAMETGGPASVEATTNPVRKIKQYRPGESPALDGTDLSTLSIEGVKASLLLTKAEIKRITKLIEEEHAEWTRLDGEYRKVKDDLRLATAYRESIANLKADHDKSHAALDALIERVPAHEKELERWKKVLNLEDEAEDLIKRAEELRKEAEAAEKEGA